MPYRLTTPARIAHQKARVLAIATTATIEKGEVTLEDIQEQITITNADLITIRDELIADGKLEQA
jgi:hypothetical protein